MALRASPFLSCTPGGAAGEPRGPLAGCQNSVLREVSVSGVSGNFP